MKRHDVGDRRAFRLVGQHRPLNRYIAVSEDFELKVVDGMITLAEENPKWSSWMIHALLVDECWPANKNPRSASAARWSHPRAATVGLGLKHAAAQRLPPHGLAPDHTASTVMVKPPRRCRAVARAEKPGASGRGWGIGARVVARSIWPAELWRVGPR